VTVLCVQCRLLATALSVLEGFSSGGSFVHHWDRDCVVGSRLDVLSQSRRRQVACIGLTTPILSVGQATQAEVGGHQPQSG